MSKELIETATKDDKDLFVEQAEYLIYEKIDSLFQEKLKEVGSEMMSVTEDIEEGNVFTTVLSQCLEEGVDINLEISADERITVTPDIAKLISEAHDELPAEFQKSFRETIFESEKKYHTILESIISGELNDD